MKLHKYFFAFLIPLYLSSNIYAQQCGFDEKRQELLQNPEYRALERAAEQKIQDVLENPGIYERSGSNNLLTIPIVIHVLHLGETVGTGTNISDAQIQSSIDNLNDFYRGQTTNSPVDFEIEFVLAKRDPSCNVTTGINRIDASAVANYSTSGVSFNGGPGANETTLKDLSRWPETDYFNVWIVTEINNNGGGSGFQGYANFYNGFAYEGSVMMHTVFGYDPTNANPSWPLNFSRDNSTVVHEAGHYFHLYHTFQGDNGGADCPADVTVGTDSDGCADTVPHRRETSTCPTNNSCTGSPWVDNNTINNIMSYYFCSDILTNDQRARSRAAMEGTSLVNSKGSVVPDPSYAAPVAVCNTNSTSTFNSGIVSVELNGNTFNSFSSGSDGGNIDVSANCSNYFEIDADESNVINVGMFPVNEQQLGIWIDWNDDGDFDDDAEQQYLQNDIVPDTVVPITLSYPVTIPYDDYVRIRLITDVDDRFGVPLINSSCFTSLVTGQSEDYTIYVKPEPVTYTYNGSWLPNNPIGICTSRDDVLIQSGNVTMTSDIDCKTLTVSPGAALSLSSGVMICAETIELNSTSQQYSSLILDGQITGTIHYNRYTSQVGPVGTNDLISTPLVGETFGNFATGNTNLAASGTVRAFAQYNTSAGAYENYDVGTNASTMISSGTGYRAATTDGSALTFTGTIASSDVLDIPISDASTGFAWNLLGNPYPSYLDFNTFFQLNKNELDSGSAFQAIYGYDGDASNGWTVWNQATIDEGSVTEVITPGQGFFVKAKSGGGLVDFTTAMRTTGSSDDFISGRPSNGNASLCKLNIISNSSEAYTQIYFIEGTTRGLDVGYDAGSYQGSAAEFSIFSNLVEDNTGLDMAIQTLPYSDLIDIVIPLGINATATNQLTIGMDSMSSIPESINVYLEDIQTNTYTLLNNSNYIFTPDADISGTGRFYIHFASQALSVDDASLDSVLIYTDQSAKEIIIKGQLDNTTNAKLYDIQGRLILSKNLELLNTTNTIQTSSLGSGIYIISLESENQTKNQKLIIK